MQEAPPKEEEEPKQEKGLFQKVKEFVSDEAYIEADIPFVKELGLTWSEIGWMSEVKKESAKALREATNLQTYQYTN